MERIRRGVRIGSRNRIGMEEKVQIRDLVLGREVGKVGRVVRNAGRKRGKVGEGQTLV